MARRLQTVIYDVTPDPGREAVFGSFTVAAGVRRAEISYAPAVLSLQNSRRYQYVLRRASTGLFATATPVVVQHAPRGGNLVRQWGAIEPLYSAPTDTTVEMRLHDGTVSIYWTGAAWAVAGANDWNTPAAVRDNFAAVTAATYPKLAPEWRLTTTNKQATPIAYGAVMAARLAFGARSATTSSPAATLSDSWDDDIVHRVLIPELLALEPEVTDEHVTREPMAAIDYSGGFGESEYVVKDVLAVYDLDTDPTMLTPLAGTWDLATRTYDLTTPLGASTTWAARIVYEPFAAFTGDRHYVASRLPQFIIEALSRVRERGGSGNVLVRDTTEETALSVPAPARKDYRATMVIHGDHMVTALELYESLRRRWNGARGAVLVSPNTGMPVTLLDMTDARPARGSDPIAAALRFDLQLRTHVYQGPETTVNLVTATDGVVVTVGYDTDVATPAGS